MAWIVQVPAKPETQSDAQSRGERPAPRFKLDGTAALGGKERSGLVRWGEMADVDNGTVTRARIVERRRPWGCPAGWGPVDQTVVGEEERFPRSSRAQVYVRAKI